MGDVTHVIHLSFPPLPFHRHPCGPPSLFPSCLVASTPTPVVVVAVVVDGGGWMDGWMDRWMEGHGLATNGKGREKQSRDWRVVLLSVPSSPHPKGEGEGANPTQGSSTGIGSHPPHRCILTPSLPPKPNRTRGGCPPHRTRKDWKRGERTRTVVESNESQPTLGYGSRSSSGDGPATADVHRRVGRTNQRRGATHANRTQRVEETRHGSHTRVRFVRLCGGDKIATTCEVEEDKRHVERPSLPPRGG